MRERKNCSMSGKRKQRRSSLWFDGVRLCCGLIVCNPILQSTIVHVTRLSVESRPFEQVWRSLRLFGQMGSRLHASSKVVCVNIAKQLKKYEQKKSDCVGVMRG